MTEIGLSSSDGIAVYYFKFERNDKSMHSKEDFEQEPNCCQKSLDFKLPLNFLHSKIFKDIVLK